jgi:hypothetical protein
LSFTWKTNRETRTKRIENINSPNYFSFWGLLVTCKSKFSSNRCKCKKNGVLCNNRCHSS